jgi:superfamily I DNA/RNA helicase
LQSDAPGWPQNPKDREFHTALINWLRFHRALLIGELVPEALRYLRNNPGCDARSAFDHVIVDEYQDLNRAEQDLIQLLSGNRAIAIVGDVDQSIYRFRHAEHCARGQGNQCLPQRRVPGRCGMISLQ